MDRKPPRGAFLIVIMTLRWSIFLDSCVCGAVAVWLPKSMPVGSRLGVGARATTATVEPHHHAEFFLFQVEFIEEFIEKFVKELKGMVSLNDLYLCQLLE